MSEMAQMSAAFQSIIPDGLLQSVEQDLKDNSAARFQLLFRGFEKYELQKFISDYLIEFNKALKDLIACLRCDGNTCLTSCTGNEKMYYGLHRRDIELYGRPKFRVFYCPGPAERKEELRRLLVSDREEPGQRTGKGQYPW